MTKKMFILLFCFALLATFGQTLGAEEIAKEGTAASTTYYTGTFKSVEMGKERVQMIYEFYGIAVSEPGNPLHNATLYGVGSLHAVNGNYTSSGFGVYTRRDGDKVYMTYKNKGKLGVGSKGVYTFVGGTGKLTGIEGGGEYVGTALAPAAEKSFQGFNKAKGSWKIP
jgi:hypothetical protein